MQNSKSLIRKIDFIFYNEREIRRRVFETRRDPNPARLLIKPSNKLQSDQTGNQAVRNLSKLRVIVFENGTELKRPEEWLEVIDETYESSDLLTSKLLREFYKNVRQEEVCERYGISKCAYYRRVRKFRMDAMLKAISRRLINLMKF